MTEGCGMNMVQTMFLWAVLVCIGSCEFCNPLAVLDISAYLTSF